MKDFSMPKVCIGQNALFFVDGDRSSEPCPAVILQVTTHQVTLIAFTISGPLLRDGVMHADDPRIKNQYNDSGAWDYTEWDKYLMNGSPLSPQKRGPGRPKKESTFVEN